MKLHVTIISLFFCNATFTSDFSVSDQFYAVKKIIASEPNVHLGPMIAIHNSIIACNSYTKETSHTNTITQYFYNSHQTRNLHNLTIPNPSLHNFIDKGNHDRTIVKTDQNGNFVIISFDETSNKITTQIFNFTQHLRTELKISALSCNKKNNTIAIGLNNGTIIRANITPTNVNFPNRQISFLHSKSPITSLYYLINNDLLFTQYKDVKLFDNTKQTVKILLSMINPIISTALYKNTVACCDNENIAIIPNISCQQKNTSFFPKIESNIATIQLYKNYLFIIKKTGAVNIYQVYRNFLNNYLMQWATIAHEAPLSSIIIDEPQQAIIVRYTKKDNNDFKLSTIIASYPTPEALNSEFKTFCNDRAHITNVYHDTYTANQNTALILYVILKNYQITLLQQPTNALLTNTIQLTILNSLDKVALPGTTHYEQIENYLAQVKNIGIDFTKQIYTQDPKELLCSFNLTLCWKIINMIYTSMEQKLTLQEQKDLLNKYPLLKNHPNYSQENYNHSY